MDRHKYIFLRATLNRVQILQRRNFLLWETMLWVSCLEFRFLLNEFELIWIVLLIDEDVEVEGVYEGSRKKKRMKDRRRSNATYEENGATGDDADRPKLKRNCMISRAVGDRWGRLAVRIQIDVRRKKFCLFYRGYEIRLTWPCTFCNWYYFKIVDVLKIEHSRYMWSIQLVYFACMFKPKVSPCSRISPRITGSSGTKLESSTPIEMSKLTKFDPKSVFGEDSTTPRNDYLLQKINNEHVVLNISSNRPRSKWLI